MIRRKKFRQEVEDEGARIAKLSPWTLGTEVIQELTTKYFRERSPDMSLLLTTSFFRISRRFHNEKQSLWFLSRKTEVKLKKKTVQNLNKLWNLEKKRLPQIYFLRPQPTQKKWDKTLDEKNASASFAINRVGQVANDITRRIQIISKTESNKKVN